MGTSGRGGKGTAGQKPATSGGRTTGAQSSSSTAGNPVGGVQSRSGVAGTAATTSDAVATKRFFEDLIETHLGVGELKRLVVSSRLARFCLEDQADGYYMFHVEGKSLICSYRENGNITSEEFTAQGEPHLVLMDSNGATLIEFIGSLKKRTMYNRHRDLVSASFAGLGIDFRYSDSAKSEDVETSLAKKTSCVLIHEDSIRGTILSFLKWEGGRAIETAIPLVERKVDGVFQLVSASDNNRTLRQIAEEIKKMRGFPGPQRANQQSSDTRPATPPASGGVNNGGQGGSQRAANGGLPATTTVLPVVDSQRPFPAGSPAGKPSQEVARRLQQSPVSTPKTTARMMNQMGVAPSGSRNTNSAATTTSTQQAPLIGLVDDEYKQYYLPGLLRQAAEERLLGGYYVLRNGSEDGTIVLSSKRSESNKVEHVPFKVENRKLVANAEIGAEIGIVTRRELNDVLKQLQSEGMSGLSATAPNINGYENKPGDYTEDKTQPNGAIVGVCEVRGKGDSGRGRPQEDSIAIETRVTAELAGLSKDEQTEVMKKTFERMQALFEGQTTCGSCACVATGSVSVKDNEAKADVVTSYVGDCVAFLAVVGKDGEVTVKACNTALHDAHNKAERARVKEGKGAFAGIRLMERDNGSNKVGGGVAVSRAIGDGKYPGLSHEPETTLTELPLKPGAKAFMVVCCDGVMEHLKGRDVAVKMAEELRGLMDEKLKENKEATPSQLAQHIVANALTKESQDNITVVVVPITENKPVTAAVFDGHGGDVVAHGLGENFNAHLADAVSDFRNQNTPKIRR